MLIGHLSDLHLRDEGDVVALEHQLDRIAADGASHVVVTGDLLDRWNPRLLTRALDAFDARRWLTADRCTIIHGNHDLASSGGHPRRRTDLFRLALRFWDPPPLLAWRRRRFYDAITARAPGVGVPPPHAKTLSDGTKLAVIDSVPFPWKPLQLRGRSVTVKHAAGSVPPPQASWLREQSGSDRLIVLMHHYPLDAPTFTWKPEGVLHLAVEHVHVPMAIGHEEQAAFWEAARAAGVRLVLCGHVHRSWLDRRDGIAVGLNGESGADWAGRTIAYYDLAATPIVRRTVASTQKR